jgi:DNA-binding CsgD family transcriptional regulator
VRWPFTGRSQETTSFFSALADGQQGAVLIGGPGVGKSRLAEELLAPIGTPTVVIRANPILATTSFGALALHLDSAAGQYDSEREALAAVSGELGGLDASILVDDAHHLDPPSAAVLHHVLEEGDGLAVITARADEPLPEPIVQLWAGEALRRIDVAPLGRRYVQRLLRAVLTDAVISSGVMETAWTYSRGNVMYLRHLVEGAIAEGTLRVRGGKWSFEPAWTPPARLTDLIHGQLQATNTQDLFRVLGVSRPLEYAILAALVSESTLSVAQRLGMIKIVESGRRTLADTGHPLFPEIAVAHSAEVDIRVTKQQLSDHIVQTGCRRDGDNTRAAQFLVESGNTVSLDLAVAASREMLGRFQPEIAYSTLQRAREGSDSHQARLLHARASRMLGRAGEAVEILEEARNKAGDDRGKAEAIALEIAVLLFSQEAERAIAIAEEGLREVRDPLARARIGTEAALGSVLAGNLHMALEYGEPVLDFPSLSQDDELAVLVTLTAAQALIGHLDRVHSRIDRGLELAAEIWAPPLARDQLLMNRTFAFHAEGLMRLAEKAALEHWDEITDRRGAMGVVGMVIADTLFECGRFELALSVLERAYEAVTSYDPFGNRGHLPLWAATIVIQIGLEEEARRWEMLSSDSEADVRWTIRRLRLNAWRALVARNWAAATKAYEEIYLVGVRSGFRTWSIYALGDALRLRAPALVQSFLRSSTPDFEGNVLGLFTDHAAALDQGDGARLDEVADRYAAHGWIVRAAEASADGARAHQVAGDEVASRRSALRAAWRSEAFESLTPPLRTMPESLTAREYNVARLVARQHSNREIADELFISVRTVENHLANSYRKLGISNRQELKTLLSLEPI